MEASTLLLISITVLLLLNAPALCQYKANQILTAETSYCGSDYYSWPQCIDTPNGYTCSCGPGFYWNTKTCISEAVDSRLEFPAPSIPTGENFYDIKPVFAYTLLLEKPFPQLEEFTVSIYLKPTEQNSTRRQSVFSYKYQKDESSYIFSLFIGPELELTIFNETVKANISGGISPKQWSHLVITWSKTYGKPHIRLNRKSLALQGSPHHISLGNVIESGGHMVLGQYSPDNNNIYDLSLAYIGSLAHVNIWAEVLDKESIHVLENDCTFTHCGDGVEWVNFREGTRGSSRLRWPSGLEDSYHHCFTKFKSVDTCDKYCSFVIGVQCKEEIKESIIWTRTPAATPDNTTAVLEVPCPGQSVQNDTSEPIKKANRTCTSSEDKVGIWGEPQVDNCLSLDFLSFTRKVRSYMRGQTFDKDYILEFLPKLRNRTRTWTYTNPVDISATIEILAKLLKYQKTEVENLLRQKSSTEATDYTTVYNELTLADTLQIADLHSEIINDLIDARNDEGWNMTIPRGQEADEILQLFDTLMDILATSLKYHTMNSETTEPHYRVSLTNLALKIEVVKKKDFIGVVFPDVTDLTGLNLSDEPGVVSFLPQDKKSMSDQISQDEYVAVAVSRIDKIGRLFYNPRFGKEDIINAPIVAVRIIAADDKETFPKNVSHVKMRLTYTDNFNISNPECVAISHGNNMANKVWSRDPSYCTVLYNTSSSVECECTGQGFFTATTDMYNDNWRIPEPPPELMTLPSYLGCSISIFLNIITVGMLIYVGTSSRTASMHKNFAVAVACNTTVFMIGITLTFNEILCQSFAIMFHYFFLAMYTWLMNETFNLYNSITYTAHNQRSQGNIVRPVEYAFGWGFPAVLVIVSVAATYNGYFSPNMCWVSWNQIWVFTGAPIGMICIILFMLTFAAVENSEVSYTKNESANKLTEYHSNAVWTQVILVTCTWAFGLLSLRFDSLVFKWVFFIFNVAQGAFLFVFFFLLNEEVRSVFKSKEIKQQLGWDVSGGALSPDMSPEESIPLTSRDEVQFYREQQVSPTADTPLLPIQAESSDDRHETERARPTVAKDSQPIHLDDLTETCV